MGIFFEKKRGNYEEFFRKNVSISKKIPWYLNYFADLFITECVFVDCIK
jgi:hypothetical protein